MRTVSTLVKEVASDLTKSNPEIAHEVAYITAGNDFVAQCIVWIKSMKMAGIRQAGYKGYYDLVETVILEYVDRLIDGMNANTDSLANTKRR